MKGRLLKDSSPSIPSKSERLREFFRRLARAPSASSEVDALALIEEHMSQVEDELTDLKNDPNQWRVIDRLFPPRPDNRRSVPNHSKIARYRSRGHNTFIGENGAIEIRTLKGDVEFTKKGADGKEVWEQ